MQEFCNGAHHIFRTYDDTTGNGKWTVEPCAQDRPTIDLCVEAYDTAFASHFGIWLNAEGRRITVCAYHMEACFAKRCSANTESINRRVVLREEKLSAGFYVVEFLASIQALEACIDKSLTNGFCSKEVYRRVVEKL